MTSPTANDRASYRYSSWQVLVSQTRLFKYRLANVDTSLVKQVFDLSHRHRETDIHHDPQSDDAGRGLEIAEWISHPHAVRNPHRQLKSVSSGTARQQYQSCVSMSRIECRIILGRRLDFGDWRLFKSDNSPVSSNFYRPILRAS